jgi:hypothetical protein
LKINESYKKVPEKLVSTSIINYSIDWTDNEGINKNEHESYLINFCDTFYDRIVDLIEKAIAKQMKITQNKYLICIFIF